MTYLIVGNKRENIQSKLTFLLKKLWDREINEDEIFNSNNPDIHILNGAEMNSIGIEDVKNLQNEMMFSPYKEVTQIAYILDAGKLTVQAQNSLLKTLEETTDTTAYILITDNENAILPTVLSRCLKIYTNMNGGEKTEDEYAEFLNLNIIDAFKRIEDISKEKNDIEVLLDSLEQHFQEELERKLVDRNGIIEVTENIKEIQLARRRIKANGNKRLVLENLFLHLQK